ncbi:hypothetical protein DIURU_001116 [Diutina rugosa]|uniref:Xylulose kinase n=1 Tax=Diutina rugosa TaxID=5481 RepID=A0A642UVP1_DIURU|nr:uncharacterized protein DIURU_001116 [Diutina rugosa]KAA8906378.1 hypothetical protein DIURU_001116 [Diutina rugosa]
MFLGFDLSTQQLKVIATDDKLKPQDTFNVEFDEVYRKKYGIKHGVVTNDADGTVVSPVAMWIDAIDYLFDEMKQKGFDFSAVKGISGSGQQHGSIYWCDEIPDDLNPKEALAPQLEKYLAYEYSPNWQDHSTGQQIDDFESTFGVDKLADTTGSRGHYRFTGLQIRKLAKNKPEVYEKTKRISLVSSFVASLMIGKIAPLEEADACGMNIYDIRKGEYNQELLELAAGVHPKLDKVSDDEAKKGAKELAEKLGEPSPVGYKHIGTVASYWVDRYGFSPECRVYSFTGDNLATILALPLSKNDCLVSLGTSTTVLVISPTYHPSPQYHMFKHPTLDDHYMGMLCYCNGALPRDKIRDDINGDDSGSWDKFDAALDESGKWNKKMGVYFTKGEIIPNAPPQTKRAQLEGKEIKYVDEWPATDDAVAIVTSQTCSARLRAGPMLDHEQPSDEVRKVYDEVVDTFGELETDGQKHNEETATARPHKCFYVGGASNNSSIIKKMGSIFYPTDGNYKVEIANACALGGAYKASWSYQCEEGKKVDYTKYIDQLSGEYEEFDVDDHWLDHLPALGMLSKMEAELDH